MVCLDTYQFGESCDWSEPPPDPPPPPGASARILYKGTFVNQPKYGWTAFMSGELCWTCTCNSSTSEVTWVPEFTHADAGQIVMRKDVHLNRGMQVVLDGCGLFQARQQLNSNAAPSIYTGWTPVTLNFSGDYSGIRSGFRDATYLTMRVLMTINEDGLDPVAYNWRYATDVANGTRSIIVRPDNYTSMEGFINYTLPNSQLYMLTGLSVTTEYLRAEYLRSNGTATVVVEVYLEDVCTKEMQFNAALGRLMAIDIDAQQTITSTDAGWTLYHEPDSVFGMSLGRVKVVDMINGWWGCYNLWGRHWVDEPPNHYWTGNVMACGGVSVGLSVAPGWSMVQAANYDLRFLTQRGQSCPP